MGMNHCPECGADYPSAVVACPRCRVVLMSEPGPRVGWGSPEVVQRVPDAAAGALLCGILEHQGIPVLLRSATLPGYGWVRRDWSTTAWGEIVVAGPLAAEARGLIADFLQALAEGGVVRDEDVEAAE
jgi:hypothetical protein